MSVYMATMTSPSDMGTAGARKEQRPRTLHGMDAKVDRTQRIVDFLADVRAQDKDDNMVTQDFPEGTPLAILVEKWRTYSDGRDKPDIRSFVRQLLASPARRDTELSRKLEAALDQKDPPKKHTLKLGASASHGQPYHRPHGNAKAQEPDFHSTLVKNQEPRIVKHPHSKSWTSSSCPGKYEPPEGSNPYHRVWLTDVGPRGRWNRDRKSTFYTTQEKQFSLPPTDEQFGKKDGTIRFWTHLLDGGVTGGGHSEKLDYKYGGPNTASSHFYVGKFENVKHYQYRWKVGLKNGKKRQIARDDRQHFDFCLHDDMVESEYKTDLYLTHASYDINRPKHTWSCPQLGADFVSR